MYLHASPLEHSPLESQCSSSTHTSKPDAHGATRPPRQPRMRRALIAALAVCACGALASCGTPQAQEKTELDFFQFKGEAKTDFEEIAADFEAENPDIDIVINQSADADTAIRTLLVKNRPPDVITLNGNGKFADLARAGVFHDFSGDPLLEHINPAVQDILADLGNAEGEVNGVGYLNNADGIIYNRQIFKEQGLEVPSTWEELLDVCEKLKAAGITPFYGTVADAWTTLPSFNGLGAYAARDGFFDTMREQGTDIGPDSAVSFQKNFTEPMQRQLTLFGYAQDGWRARTYDDGNAAFANGEVAMLMQGIWALNPIRQANPDVDAAIFPYPAPEGEGADQRLLVTGVDVVVTMGKGAAHPEEARRFFDYLFQPEVIEKVAKSQSMFPSLREADYPDDPAIQELAPFFDGGHIAGFVDHHVPASIRLDPLVQQGLFDADPSVTLQQLDRQWREYAARTVE